MISGRNSGHRRRLDTNRAKDVFVRDLKRGVTRRVSVSSSGEQTSRASFVPAISGDGRFVAFLSNAPNLVAGDANAKADIFVHDLKTGRTRLVSVSSSGAQENDNSTGDYPAISADGRYMAFSSYATNLVGNDTNGGIDVFLRDLKTDKTRRVSLSSTGAQSGCPCDRPSISADGDSVAFESQAYDLVPDDTNSAQDIFVRDVNKATTTRVSLGPDGVQANGGAGYPAIAANGRRIAFDSQATNLTPHTTGSVSNIFVGSIP